MSNYLKIFATGVFAVVCIFISVGMIAAVEIWFKRDVLGVPYCISGGKS